MKPIAIEESPLPNGAGEASAGAAFPLTGQDIICVSSIDWDFLWQQHQEIMSFLAAAGNRVLFIDNTGVRAPKFSDMPRIMQRMRNWKRSLRGFRKEREGLYVYSPLLLPFPYSFLARWVNRRWLVSSIRSWMRSVGFHDPILWTFLPTHVTLDLADAIDCRLLVYYCTDNFAATSPGARRIVETEAEVLRRADCVFAMSKNMLEHCRAYHWEAVQIPMGVNAALFEEAKQRVFTKPQELQGIATPILGYIGGVRPSIDQALVAALAEAFAHCTLVFVGPVQTDIEKLSRYKNVLFLGAKPHEEMPRYIQAFDCCLLPYLKDDYTDSISPAKLHEYLMMGKPVVSTDLREVSQYGESSIGQPIVYLADSPAVFIAAVNRALSETGPQAKQLAQRRLAAAKEQAWPAKVRQMAGLMKEKLIQKDRARVAGWQQSLAAWYSEARVSHWRIVKVLAAVLFAYLLVFYSPLFWWIAKPLRFADAPAQADAIVVLAGGAGDSGEAPEGYEERVVYAVGLYRHGYATRMIFSSGYRRALEETQLMSALAVSLGVPSDAIILETQSRSTYQNLQNVKQILDARQWRSILLVSSPYHMRRLRLVAAKTDPGRIIYYSPPPKSLFYEQPPWQPGEIIGRTIGPKQVRGILHEYFAIAYYWWRGWL